MKKKACYTAISLATIILLHAGSLFAAPPLDVIALKAETFEHVQFKKIPASKYSFDDGVLKVEVDSSASFLMMPFDTVRQVRNVSFQWHSDGLPRVNDAQQESTRSGDDSVIKIGLLLQADEASFNPFLPSWMKRVHELMHYPSENMVYLVADSKHAAGDDWLNPYNKRVLMVPVSSVAGDDGWQQASHRFEQPLSVVAIWIMADGDNTGSRFTSYIKKLKFE